MERPTKERQEAILKAASAAGIDADTLWLFQSEADAAAAPAELEVPRLTDGEWELLAPVIPHKTRYLSRIAPRDFLDGCLFLAMCDFKFRLVPTPNFNTEAFRAKFYRSCLAGLFTDLTAVARTRDDISPAHTALLGKLRAAEERYIYRHRKIVEQGRDQLARALANPLEPG